MYNRSAMILNADFMRFLLLLCWTGMAALGVFYLRGRRLDFYGYLGWGIFTILVPLLGPFLAILLRPGRSLHRRPPRKRPAVFKLPRLRFS